MKNIRYINAGAGSGKTFTLTELLSDLIAKKETTPSRVILTTFTKNASEEFKTKAREKLISKGLHESASQMDAAMIGTVHSIAFSFVKKYWYLLGLGADAQMMEEDEIEIAVQVNGKVRATISVPKDISKDDAIAKAKETLGDRLSGSIVKEIYVPGKIVNIVAK